MKQNIFVLSFFMLEIATTEFIDYSCVKNLILEDDFMICDYV